MTTATIAPPKMHICPPWCDGTRHDDFDGTERTHMRDLGDVSMKETVVDAADDLIRAAVEETVDVKLWAATTTRARHAVATTLIELHVSGASSGFENMEWLTAAEARRLAALLTRAADLADSRADAGSPLIPQAQQ